VRDRQEKDAESYLPSRAQPPLPFPTGLGGLVSELGEIHSAGSFGPAGPLGLGELLVRVHLLREPRQKPLSCGSGVLPGVTLCSES
jgi:hypothetical protein